MSAQDLNVTGLGANVKGDRDGFIANSEVTGEFVNGLFRKIIWFIYEPRGAKSRGDKGHEVITGFSAKYS